MNTNHWIAPSHFLKLAIFLLLLPGIFGLCFGQNATQKVDDFGLRHSPQKAFRLSLIPGLGQAYNKKYWKIPIIYGGFGVLYYFRDSNRDEYLKFREAYNYVSSGETTPINNEYVGRYDVETLKSGRDYYRRNLELTYIFAGVLYILNLVDATVDAHFYSYDINDNLSMSIQPMIPDDPGKPYAPGISLYFHLLP